MFRAFSDPQAKALWFTWPEDMVSGEPTFDFRVGGKEHNAGGPPGAPVHVFNTTYYDIVQDERIFYAYEMHLRDDRISVSLTTVELLPVAEGTRLVLTEHGAFREGYDDPAAREHGTNELLDALGASLEPVSA